MMADYRWLLYFLPGVCVVMYGLTYSLYHPQGYLHLSRHLYSNTYEPFYERGTTESNSGWKLHTNDSIFTPLYFSRQPLQIPNAYKPSILQVLPFASGLTIKCTYMFYPRSMLHVTFAKTEGQWLSDIYKFANLTLKVLYFWKFTSYCSLKPNPYGRAWGK